MKRIIRNNLNLHLGYYCNPVGLLITAYESSHLSPVVNEKIPTYVGIFLFEKRSSSFFRVSRIAPGGHAAREILDIEPFLLEDAGSNAAPIADAAVGHNGK